MRQDWNHLLTMVLEQILHALNDDTCSEKCDISLPESNHSESSKPMYSIVLSLKKRLVTKLLMVSDDVNPLQESPVWLVVPRNTTFSHLLQSPSKTESQGLSPQFHSQPCIHLNPLRHFCGALHTMQNQPNIPSGTNASTVWGT